MTPNQVNHLNSALMIASLVAAFFLPFELFLLSYAILGPLHYLTEMSWLHDRNYFMPSRWMALPVGVLTLTAVLTGALPKALTDTFPSWLQPEAVTSWNAESVAIALFLSLVFLLARTTRGRLIGAGVVVGSMLLAHYGNHELRVLAGAKTNDHGAFTFYDVFFTIFLTTIIHVFVFTAAFVLFGALKSQSRTGMVSFVILLLCGIACFVVPVHSAPQLSEYTFGAYNSTSLVLDKWMLAYGTSENASLMDVYRSEGGIKVARFIAFAYTYHYLNWFSKTSVIKWHEVPRLRLVLVVAIWLVSLWLYYKDYILGLKWLLLLSMLHVFLEFPLNWQSFFGIKDELKKRLNAG